MPEASSQSSPKDVERMSKGSIGGYSLCKRVWEQQTLLDLSHATYQHLLIQQHSHRLQIIISKSCLHFYSIRFQATLFYYETFGFVGLWCWIPSTKSTKCSWRNITLALVDTSVLRQLLKASAQLSAAAANLRNGWRWWRSGQSTGGPWNLCRLLTHVLEAVFRVVDLKTSQTWQQESLPAK